MDKPLVVACRGYIYKRLFVLFGFKCYSRNQSPLKDSFRKSSTGKRPKNWRRSRLDDGMPIRRVEHGAEAAEGKKSSTKMEALLEGYPVGVPLAGVIF